MKKSSQGSLNKHLDLSNQESLYLLIFAKCHWSEVKSLSRAWLFATPWTVACTKLLRPTDFLGKSTGVGCHFLLQGIFLTQGTNSGLLHCRQRCYLWATREAPVKDTEVKSTKASVLIGERRGDFTHREESHVKMEVETEVMELQAKEC